MLAARYENDGYVYMAELLEKGTAYYYKGYGNFSDIKLIRENYTNLKNKLGHIPALADFDKYEEMDVLRIFDNNSLGSLNIPVR